jgi:hypothetical protein
MYNSDLSKSEFDARKRMIELCITIAIGCEDLLDEEFVDEYPEG